MLQNTRRPHFTYQRACEVKLPEPRLIAKCDNYQFQRLILQFPAQEKKYRIASMFIITPRDVERRESGSMFCDTNHFLKFERIE